MWGQPPRLSSRAQRGVPATALTAVIQWPASRITLPKSIRKYPAKKRGAALERKDKCIKLNKIPALGASQFSGSRQAPQITAQESDKSETSDKEAKPAKPAPEPPAPKEESSVTEHTIKIGGQTIAYKATASTTLIKDDKGEPTASIFTIAYTRTTKTKQGGERGKKRHDMSQRPIAFVYNGGPGSSSIWLHMGAFGPRRVVTTDAGPTPPPPFKLVDNADCLLDKTDLVFIDPVGTGFSRAVGKAKDKDFWGIDQDVKSLAQLIATYVSRNGRWNSPKFLIGESYGTFRSAALGNYLQIHNGMYFNGIVLISSVLDLSTLSFPLGNDMPYVFYLPSYAAAASYHKMLKDQPADLNAFLAEARQFASTEYAGALMKGANLSAAEKSDIAKKLSRFTGLSEDYLIKADLRVKLSPVPGRTPARPRPRHRPL